MKYSYNSSYNKPDKRLLVLISAIVIVAALGILFSSGITGMFVSEEVIEQVNDTEISEEVEVCKEVIETYTELEPYVENQCINVPSVETVCDTKDVKYSVVLTKCEWTNGFSTLNSKCVINNFDDREIEFTIDVGIVNKNSEKIGEKRTTSVLPHESTEIVFSYDIDVGNCYCNEVEIPQKEICYDKIVDNEECFELNKYREVEKTRVIKSCD